jgi:hypothetical protein
VTSNYPVFALLVGVALFSLAPTYWGWLYVVGLVFFLLPFAMAAEPLAAPFLFGGVWAAALLVMALRLRRLAALARVPAQPAVLPGG